MANVETTVERLQTYSPEDAAALGVLREHMSSWRPNVPVQERILRDFAEHPDQRVLVVARLATDGLIVSAETLNLSASPDVGAMDIGRSAILGFVSTHNDYRKRGIFGKVWLEGLEWCAENEIDTINFWSRDEAHRQDARRFYTNHGAKPVPTELFRLHVEPALKYARREVSR